MIRSYYFLHKSSIGALRSSRRVPNTSSTNWIVFDSVRAAAAAGSLGSSSGSSSGSNAMQLNQTRNMWSLIGGGLALFAVSRVALVGISKLESLLSNDKNKDGNAVGSSKSSNAAASSESNDSKGGNKRSPSSSSQSSSSAKSSASSQKTTAAADSKPKKVTIKNAFGIDFGSSSAKLAYRDAAKVALIDTNDGRRYTPSSIHFSSDKIVAGQIAKSVRWLKQQHTISSIPPMIQYMNLDSSTKSFLESFGLKADSVTNDGDLTFNLAGVDHKLSDLQASLLQEVIKSAMSKAENYKRLPFVVSLPQFLAKSHHATFIDSCKAKSLPIIGTVGDAISAYLGSVYLGLVPRGAVGTYMVVDIGGKYTQFSTLEQNDSEPIPVVTSSHVTYKCSCDSIDHLLVHAIGLDFSKKNNLTIDILKDNMAMQRIYDAVENAKIDLSRSTSTNINVPYLTADASGPKHLDFTLSRANMDKITATLIDAFKADLSSYYSEQSKVKSIDYVILVGGGARMISFRQEVEKLLGKVPIISDEPEEVVSIGSAIYSEIM